MSKQEFLNSLKKASHKNKINEIILTLITANGLTGLFFIFTGIGGGLLISGVIGFISIIYLLMVSRQVLEQSLTTLKVPNFKTSNHKYLYDKQNLFKFYFGKFPDLPKGFIVEFYDYKSFIDKVSDEQFEQVTKQLLLIHEFKQSPLQKTNNEVYTQELNNLLTDFYKLVSNFVTVYAVQDVYKVSLLENGYEQDVFEIAKYDSNFANYKKNVLKLRFPVSNIAFNDFKPLETDELLACYLEHVKEQGTLERNSKYHTLNEFKQEYSRGTFL